MAVGAGTRNKLEHLLGSSAGADVANQIDSGGNPVADNVAVLGETSDLSAADVTSGGTANVTAENVASAIDAVIAEVESRLDDIEAKVDAVIDALTGAGIMSSS